MHHLRALALKTLTLNAALQRALARLGRRPARRDVFLAAAGLAAIGYLLDLALLPRQGNRRTALADAGLAALVLCLARRALPRLRPGPMGAVAGALAVALEELWFHAYLSSLRPGPAATATAGPARSGGRG